MYARVCLYVCVRARARVYVCCRTNTSLVSFFFFYICYAVNNEVTYTTWTSEERIFKNNRHEATSKNDDHRQSREDDARCSHRTPNEISSLSSSPPPSPSLAFSRSRSLSLSLFFSVSLFFLFFSFTFYFGIFSLASALFSYKTGRSK